MATNICSKKRPKYAKVKELAEELNCTEQQIYKTVKRPDMKDTVKKIGRSGIRIDVEKFYTRLEQIYR